MHITFSTKTPEEEIRKRKGGIFNFSNLHNVYWIFNDTLYGKEVTHPRNIHFPDGKRVAVKLKLSQKRGPEFLKRFICSAEARNKRHFILGVKQEDKTPIAKVSGISKKNLGFFNLSFVQGIEFPIKERKDILRKLKKFKPDYIWMAVATPKQDLLANQLYRAYPCFYFDVGAAFDFLLGRKKEAPKIWTKLGLEWFYRLVTDYKYTKKKVQRHFSALKYLKFIRRSDEV